MPELDLDPSKLRGGFTDRSFAALVLSLKFEACSEESPLFSIRPTSARVLAKFRDPPPLFDVADEVSEIEPASSFETAPAICLPGEIDRITHVLGDENLHRARLAGGIRREGATLAYRFDDALVADFTVYAGGSYQVYREIRKRPVLSGSPDEIGEAQLCTTPCAQMYFGHFFHDSLVLEELAAQRQLTPLTFARKPWLHEPKYRQLFEREAVPTSLGRVRQLWIVDETALNEGWRSRLRELRGRLRSKVSSTGARDVFITRGTLFSGRSLGNEPELAELLKRQGFTILEPEKEDPEVIAATLRDARLVVSVTGSAEVHALVAMPMGATVIEIQIAAFFGTIGKTLFESIGVNWGYVVAEASPGGGFRLEPERLLRTLDLVR